MSSAAVVLCGGYSSRMKRAKAWLPWFGQSLLEHVVGQVAGAVEEVVVVTSEELDPPPSLAARKNLRVVRDRAPGLGPLAGLREGLEAATGEFTFVTSTDAPFVTAAYVETLLAQARAEELAIAPVAEGHQQVLSAVYPARAARVSATLLAEGVSRPRALLERVGFSPAALPENLREAAAPPWRGCNTPAAYLDCVRHQDPAAICEVELLGHLAVGAPGAVQTRPVGTLGEVLGGLDAAAVRSLAGSDALPKRFLASLGGRDLVRDLGIPIGPGERVSVFDALAGG